jgi:hypothetical protein
MRRWFPKALAKKLEEPSALSKKNQQNTGRAN